jgi:hypothetical protein
MNPTLFARAAAPLLAIALLAAPAAHAATVFDNTAAAQDGADPIQSYGPLAISFSTGANAGSLGSVAAVLKSDSADLNGALDLVLLADAGNAPGAAIATLATLPVTSIGTDAFSLYGFGTLASTALAADTTYWIELVADGGAAVEWSWSDDLSGTGVAGQSSYSQEFGVLANSDGGPYQAAITVSSVPEPTSALLLALGLGAVGVAGRRSARRG